MRVSFLGLLLVCSVVTSAQSISLNGVVVVQNSQYETGQRQYVKDAAVRAPFAKAVTSDREGVFSLAFADLPDGAPVRIDVEKSGFKVVNTRDIEAVVFGRTPLLEVVMADPGKLADAQLRFYNVVTTSVETNYERRMSSLRDEQQALDVRLDHLGQELEHTLTSLGEAMEVLAVQRETALQQADDLACTFAYVDLDKASDLYRRAYEQLLRGQADSVLAMLDKNRLDADYASARITKERGADLVREANVSIRQLFDSYQLKADVLRLSLDLRGSLVVLNAMRIIQDENADVFGTVDRALLLRASGKMQTRLAQLPAAHRSLQESLDLFVQHHGPNHTEVGAAQIALADLLEEEGLLKQSMAMYVAALRLRKGLPGTDPATFIGPLSGMGDVFRAMGEFDSALVYTRKALDAVHASGRSGTVDEATLTNALALELKELGHYEEAMPFYRQVLALQKALIAQGVKEVDLSTVYGNLGSLCDVMGQYDMAMRYNDSCLVIEERMYGTEHTLPALTINNIGTVLSNKGDDQGALDKYRYSLSIIERLLDPDHFRIGLAHDNIAVTLDDMGRRSEALPHYDEALRIYRLNLPPDHPAVATSLANKAFTLGALGDGKAAMELHREALRIRIATYGEMHDAVAASYSYMALEWERAGEVDSALFHYEKSLAIGMEVLGADHISNGHVHENLVSIYLLAGNTAEATIHAERALTIVVAVLGDTSRQLASIKALLAQCYRTTGKRDEAISQATGSFRLQPSVHSAWILFQLANDVGDTRSELDHLVHCMEELSNAGPDVPVDPKVVRAAFVQRATAAGRQDLIQKFPAEP